MMITEIALKNFKCFKNISWLPIRRVNLFTGINGRGKSTALQALLLMRQSSEHSRTTNQVILNGSCIEAGRFVDLKNSFVSREEAIELMFTFQKNADTIKLHYALKENHEDEMVADIERLIGTGEISGKTSSFHVNHADFSHEISYEHGKDSANWYNLFVANMEDKGAIFKFAQSHVNFSQTHYLSADRIGPQDFYPKQSFAEFPNVGRRGEYTANLISKKKNELVHEKLRLDEAETDTVIDQTEAWLSRLFDGGRIDIKPLDANIVVMEMNSENSSYLYKPVNVGFGYSYALPIIVSGLVAKEGERLIVENPEAHLHPFAQSQITKFLAQVSTCGVQVFIESHSDYILNALRIVVLDRLIKPEDLNVLYFQRDQDTQVVEVPVNADGSIEQWPSGFFDQTDEDFKRLFGV